MPRLASWLLQQFLALTGAIGDSLSVCVSVPKLSRWGSIVSVSREFMSVIRLGLCQRECMNESLKESFRLSFRESLRELEREI